MKNTLHLLILISISAFALYCKADSNEDILDNSASDSIYTITVNFEYDEDFSPSALKNIYIIWMEDTISGFIQNIFICQKLITGGLTGTVLPYWKINKYPVSSSSEIDAVTSATKANTDFSVSAVLKNSTIRNFVLYFEVDRYSEPNDWFTDQPARLYSVGVNLDDGTSEYELLPIGWTPNENTQNQIPNTPMGQLQKEMKYITNHKQGSSFGVADERSSTKMFKKITATIKSSVATKIVTLITDDFSISLFPNPTHEQVNIKSKEIIKEVIITNIQGQTILYIQPKTFETAIVLSKAFAPAGTYYAKIMTSKGVTTHKILITE